MTQDLDPGRDRRTASGLLGGAVACAVLSAGTGSEAPVWLAAGMLVGALMVYRRTVPPRPYAFWSAWATGAVLALLLAWALEGSRFLLLPWAGFEAVVALVLALLWYRRRNGRGDWIVWRVEERLVLRREWSFRDAVRWAELTYRGPCEISRLDEFPEMAAEVPR
ncbi:MAG TPA: hypothetical protein VGD71_33365, partial [Kribbella sp.]